MKTAIYGGTRNLYPLMAPAIKSLLTNTSVDQVYLLVEDDKFPEWLPDCVHTVNVSNQPYFDPKGPNYNNHWTYMTMMKAAYWKMFPDVDKALCLDIDTYVEQNVDELWDIDMTDIFCAGVRDRVGNGSPYINAGSMMLNLELLRKTGVGEKLIAFLNTKKTTYPEQDAINIYCKGKILNLPGDYNASKVTELTSNPKIVHFAGYMYWTNNKYTKKWTEAPWPDRVMPK